jgi:hypothetical protein
MADVVAARDAYLDARKLVARRRLELGRAIVDARLQHIKQEAIASTLRLTREQVRRYQFEYEKWLADQSAPADA